MKRGKLTNKGYKYDTFYEGKNLCKGVYDPEFDSCRALRGLGLTGEVRFFTVGNANYRVRIPDLEVGAQKGVIDPKMGTIFIRKWAPPPTGLGKTQ